MTDAKDENFDKPLKDVGFDQDYEDKQREADDIINDFENW